MKNVRALTATTAAVVLAALAPLPATGAGPAPTQVTIATQAQYVTEVLVSVAMRVTCGGAPQPGTVFVTVEQSPPETQSTTIGTGQQVVVCDGRSHDVAVTVTGGSFSGFDIGKAFATATLVAPSGTDMDARQIMIGF